MAKLENIDYESLEHIGFTEGRLLHLEQKCGLSAELLQDSIDAFAFDLAHNKKAETLKKNRWIFSWV